MVFSLVWQSDIFDLCFILLFSTLVSLKLFFFCFNTTMRAVIFHLFRKDYIENNNESTNNLVICWLLKYFKDWALL